MLADKKALKGVKVRRITFNEITRNAIRDAMAHPRDLDQPLIEAYLARRALDYLVGFTLSPVLWRKLPGSRSAGRVQSVALRLICEREAEIEVFRAREYWTIEADFITPGRRAVHRAADPSERQAARPVRPEQRSTGAMRAKAAVEAGTLPRRLGREASASSAIRRRRSPPRPCSRRPRASWASARSRPCAARSSSTRASISTARPPA